MQTLSSAWHHDNPAEVLNKYSMMPHVAWPASEEVFGDRELIKTSFRISGIYPWDRTAVHWEKLDAGSLYKEKTNVEAEELLPVTEDAVEVMEVGAEVTEVGAELTEVWVEVRGLGSEDMEDAAEVTNHTTDETQDSVAMEHMMDKTVDMVDGTSSSGYGTTPGSSAVSSRCSSQERLSGKPRLSLVNTPDNRLSLVKSFNALYLLVNTLYSRLSLVNTQAEVIMVSSTTTRII